MTYIRHEYDPVKAHLYYVQNRKLKGRQKGEAPPPPEKRQAKDTSTNQTPKGAQHHKATFTKHESNAAIKAAAEARVVALKARLEKLRAELKGLVEEAKKRSSVDLPQKNDQQPKGSQTKSGSSKEKPRSQSEKDKAAKAAKERYNKEHPEAALLTQIADIQKKIEKKREELLKSVKTARRKAAVQFVSKRPTG